MAAKGHNNFISVDIDTKELERRLSKFDKAFQSKFLEGLLVHSVKPMVRAAQDKAPLDTGILSDSIGVIRLKKARFTSVIIGPRVTGKYKGSRDKSENKGGWYGHFLEFGTPKQPPQPYMRPAWDSKRKEVESRFMKAAIRRLKKAEKGLVK